MKLRSIVSALVYAALPGLLSAAVTPSANFNLEQSTMAPGTVLQPGAYSIRIVDHLQDRFLVTVEGSGGAFKTTFIAVPSKSPVAQAGAINWPTALNGKTALRGFIFRNGNTSLEFVYPKDEAVSIAKANGISVLAVDPASEGRPSELAQLSSADMQMVTLWTLTPERVSGQASEVGISAKKYQNIKEQSSNREVASLNKPPTALQRLPRTASTLPLILLGGILAMLAAGLLRVWRRSAAMA